MANVAFIGLGAMGFPLAGHLARAGHHVTVYNRSPAKALAWCRQYAGVQAATPAQAAREAEFVLTCVGNDDDVRSVVYGAAGILASLPADAILIDHTTASAALARELAAAAHAAGRHFIDAPVSGGQVGAEQGQLSIMCGGEPAAYARAAPILDSYARLQRLLGGPGSGQLAKMVNQICVAGLLQGLAEGLNFAQQADLDADAVLEVIAQGAAGSWQMDHRAQTMLADQFDFGFAVDWMRKDLAICLDEARRNGAQLPVTALVEQFYADIQAMQGGRWDTSSLIRRLKR